MKMLLLILIFASAFAACKKNDSEQLTEQERITRLLVNKKWKVFEEHVCDSTGIVGPDIYPNEPDYVKDNYSIFYDDGTFLSSDSSIWLPGAKIPHNDTGTWVLIDNRIQQTSGKPQTTYLPLTIMSINDTNMVVEVQFFRTTLLFYLEVI